MTQLDGKAKGYYFEKDIGMFMAMFNPLEVFNDHRMKNFLQRHMGPCMSNFS
jgi:hypothetical protein